MKKYIIKIAVCILVFLCTLFISSSLYNQGNEDMTTTMEQASLPIVHITNGNISFNTLYGYRQDMDGRLLRDTITPLETGRSLSFSIEKYENEINEAVKKDLGKCEFDGFMCETGLVLMELNYMIRHTFSYAKKHRVYTPIGQCIGSGYKKASPYGNVLIMSPWNYPFLLTMTPISDAIAAGNTIVVKPSAYSPASSEVIKKII